MTAERIIVPQISFSNLVQLITEAWRWEERCSDALITQQPLHHQHLLLRETTHLLLLKPPSLAYHWLINSVGKWAVCLLTGSQPCERRDWSKGRRLSHAQHDQTHPVCKRGWKVFSRGSKAGRKVRIGPSWREDSLFTHTKGPICISVPTHSLACLKPQRWLKSLFFLQHNQKCVYLLIKKASLKHRRCCFLFFFFLQSCGPRFSPVTRLLAFVAVPRTGGESQTSR